MESRQSGAYHIASNQREYNPQRKNNFTLLVHGLNGLRRVGTNPDEASNEINTINNAQEEIILGLKSCETPNFNTDTIVVNRGNSQIKFAGKPTFADINMVAYDFIGSNVKDTLLAWQNQVYNTSYDFIGSKGSYKKDCVLYEYDPKGNEVRHWDIRGAFPTSVNPDNFDYEDGGQATISVTLSIDWAELKLPDGE